MNLDKRKKRAKAKAKEKRIIRNNLPKKSGTQIQTMMDVAMAAAIMGQGR